jgi:hypothetical protein
MSLIQIPLEEYQTMQEELSLLRNSELMSKINRLVDILFQEKYNLFMGNYTEDLTANSINNAWKQEDTNAWNEL